MYECHGCGKMELGAGYVPPAKWRSLILSSLGRYAHLCPKCARPFDASDERLQRAQGRWEREREALVRELEAKNLEWRDRLGQQKAEDA